MTRLARFTLTAALATAAALVGASPAYADRTVAAACAEPGIAISDLDLLWPQQSLAPERAWPFSTGVDITVAVLDSGVDAGHPQLAGRVMAGYDAVGSGGRADNDCVGTGTQVAGVIAARSVGTAGFSGFAPGVTILPIRVVHPSFPGLTDPQVLAEGIDAAVDGGAEVIAIPVVTYVPDNRVRDAVARAVGAGITVVAAAGDLGDQLPDSPIPYPAAYPGVIGVGAIDPTGAVWASSQHGEYVDLVAPGVAVPTLQTGSGMTMVPGSTGIACGFVAATAALVRSRSGGGLSGAQVTGLLLGTATPAATGPRYGHGIVNPYAAVTNQIVDAAPATLPPLAAPVGQPAGDPAWRAGRDLALAGTAAALVVAVVVVMLAIAVPRGRRRFWRGTLAPRDTRPPEPDEPGPPLLLFEENAARPRGR